MPVCRLIFRLDFDLNYDIVEHPGEVMRLIDQLSDDNCEMKESQQRRGVEGSYVSDDGRVVSEFTVEPRNIVASYELADGFDLDKLAVDEGFLLLTKLSNAVCEKFHINDIKRSGIRIFYFGKVQNEGGAFTAYRSFINSDLIGGIENSIGDIDDYGINVNGVSEEQIKYSCRTGPLKRDEDYTRYFQRMASKISESSSWDFIIDVDLYEQNIAISKIPMHKWFRPKIEKATNLINHIESEIEKNRGD